MVSMGKKMVADGIVGRGEDFIALLILHDPSWFPL